MTATRVLILRHGESAWNAEGRWQGAADPPLSARGRDQAVAAAAALARLGSFDLLVTSDLERAASTGGLIADALGLHVRMRDEGLNERDVGDWQGLTNSEIDDRYPGARAAGRRPDRWEHDDDVLARARASLVELARSQPGATVLVVSHGGVIGVLQRDGGFDGPRMRNLDGRWLRVEHDCGNAKIVVEDHVALLPET